MAATVKILFRKGKKSWGKVQSICALLKTVLSQQVSLGITLEEKYWM